MSRSTYGKVHTDQPISIDTARLLGCAFGLSDAWLAYKFMPAGDGTYIVLRRSLHGQDSWAPMEWPGLSCGHLQNLRVYLVTFPDEQGEP